MCEHPCYRARRGRTRRTFLRSRQTRPAAQLRVRPRAPEQALGAQVGDLRLALVAQLQLLEERGLVLVVGGVELDDGVGVVVFPWLIVVLVFTPRRFSGFRGFFCGCDELEAVEGGAGGLGGFFPFGEADVGGGDVAF